MRHTQPAHVAHRCKGQEEAGYHKLLVCQSTRLEVLVAEQSHMIGYQRHHDVQMTVGVHAHTKTEKQRWEFGQNKGMPWRV